MLAAPSAADPAITLLGAPTATPPHEDPSEPSVTLVPKPKSTTSSSAGVQLDKSGAPDAALAPPQPEPTAARPRRKPDAKSEDRAECPTASMPRATGVTSPSVSDDSTKPPPLSAAPKKDTATPAGPLPTISKPGDIPRQLPPRALQPAEATGRLHVRSCRGRRSRHRPRPHARRKRSACASRQSPVCLLRLSDPEVSRRHASLAVTATHLQLIEARLRQRNDGQRRRGQGGEPARWRSASPRARRPQGPARGTAASSKLTQAASMADVGGEAARDEEALSGAREPCRQRPVGSSGRRGQDRQGTRRRGVAHLARPAKGWSPS